MHETAWPCTAGFQLAHLGTCCLDVVSLSHLSPSVYVRADHPPLQSVEGSTIIIAACIPLLQPLLKLIRGRAADVSYRNRYSARLEDHDRNARTPSIPLSAGASGYSKPSTKMSPDPDSRSDTVALRSDGAEIEGAERRAYGGYGAKGDKAIQRVDEVQVSYEDRELERELAGTSGP